MWTQVQFLAARDVDNIVVVSNGRLAEQGKYADLIAAGGQFASLVEAQQKKQEVPSNECDA